MAMGQQGSLRMAIDLEPSLAPACMIKLSPAVLDALRSATSSGDGMSIRFLDQNRSNVLEIGSTQYSFTSLPETGCEILQAQAKTRAGPDSSPGKATLVAQIRHKLILRRSLGEERGRMRARAEEAERKLGERRTVVLGSSGKKPSSRQPVTKATTTTTMRRGVSEGSLLTLGGGKVRASSPAVAVPVSTARRSVTPPLMSSLQPGGRDLETSKGLSRPASVKRLRVPSPAPPENKPNAGGVSPLSDAVRAASKSGSLRTVLIVALGERPMSMATLRAFLPVAAAASGGALQVPASRDALERAVRSVASLHPTGRYHLLDPGPGRPSPEPPEGGPLSSETTPRSREGSQGQEASASPDNKGLSSRSLRSTETKPSSSSGTSGRRPSRPPLSSTSSASRSLTEADEAWLDSVIEAGPRTVDPVATPEEFHVCQEEFNRKHETYFRLHQIIQANRSDFVAWKEALEDPKLPADTREKIERKIEDRWRKQASRVQRWDSAFRVLHEELEAIKSRLEDYVLSVEASEREMSI